MAMRAKADCADHNIDTLNGQRLKPWLTLSTIDPPPPARLSAGSLRTYFWSLIESDADLRGNGNNTVTVIDL